MLDSAQVCLENVFNSETDILSKIQAAKYLKEIHTKKGESEKVYKYDKFLSPLALESYEQKHDDSQMIDLFEKHQKQAMQKGYKKKTLSLVRKTFLMIVLITLVVIPIIIFVSRKRHLRKLSDVKSAFENEKQQNVALVNEMQMSNILLKEENQRLSEGLKAMQNMQKPTLKEYEKLMKEPVIRNLISRISNIDIITTNPSSLYEKHSMTPKEKRMFTDVFDKYCPNFNNRIFDLYPDLNKPEAIVCQYLILGLTVPQTAVLIQKDKSTVYRNERNIKEKMNCEDICQHLKSMLFDISEDK